MLPLNGVATTMLGFDPAEPRQVLRLRVPTSGPRDAADVALTHRPDDLDAAMSSGFARAFVVSDEADALSRANRFVRVIHVPSKFDYLADGDILGFHPDSKRFRTLYVLSNGRSFASTEVVAAWAVASQSLARREGSKCGSCWGCCARHDCFSGSGLPI
jgi:hypothetical protein